MAANILTQARLRELFDYNTDTGVFTRRVRTSKRSAVGDIAGHMDARGRTRIKIDDKQYFAHRLAWLYVTGSWPAQQIDHIDGSPRNNAFANLRDVSPSVNVQNQRRAQSDNRSGFFGVTKRHGKWGAAIQVNSKTMNLGHFDTPEQAHAVYLEAKRRLHPGCSI